MMMPRARVRALALHRACRWHARALERGNDAFSCSEQTAVPPGRPWSAEQRMYSDALEVAQEGVLGAHRGIVQSGTDRMRSHHFWPSASFCAASDSWPCPGRCRRSRHHKTCGVLALRACSRVPCLDRRMHAHLGIAQEGMEEADRSSSCRQYTGHQHGRAGRPSSVARICLRQPGP